ncbi:GyrI-like domain-containing protein [Paraferrimonas sedimenticola]|uniref:AraC effector-binding domain-containing protein n=1 Tax=Paraferrimonas sedimenticola TaxID=375674 RepID=A0AA37RYK7_9GAMM|nr:GyrI-like domain-containing protein [Paraferrimonas sedimenticola]GLP97669.1 hypothetical protein GCM10007895_29760 [Paraferrimonas sedimenticola]
MTPSQQTIEERQLPSIEVVSQRWSGSYQDTGKAMKHLYRSAARYAAGKAFNLYYDSEYKSDNADIESCLPVKQALSGKVESRTLAGGLFVCLVHQGSYQTLSQSYAKVFSYIEAQGYRPELPYREVFFKGPGMIFKGNPNKYLTEIQIPIAKI